MDDITESNEEWRDVVGLEGKYSISNLGRIRSIEREVLVVRKRSGVSFMRHIYPKIISTNIGTGGYYRLTICKKYFAVHRMIAMAFIPNPENLPEINHIDGVKTNNSISNLEWCTRSHNMIHVLLMGLKEMPKGERNGYSVLKEKDIFDMRKLFKKGISSTKISRIYNCSLSTISRIRRGERWNHI